MVANNGIRRISATILKPKSMTKKKLESLGFEKVKEYYHDDYFTERFRNGELEVELTYEKGQLITCDLTMDEVNCKPITEKEIQVLTPIFGKN
jgi:hypothetical protein